jgi:hypothetical protein
VSQAKHGDTNATQNMPPGGEGMVLPRAQQTQSQSYPSPPSGTAGKAKGHIANLQGNRKVEVASEVTLDRSAPLRANVPHRCAMPSASCASSGWQLCWLLQALPSFLLRATVGQLGSTAEEGH